MQGIFINGRRPKSKKEVKEAIVSLASTVSLEATSMYGNEYDGDVFAAPNGSYHFVGPDPDTKRSFYGTVTVKDGKVTVK